MLSQLSKALLLSILIISFSTKSAEYENFYHEASEHFRHACLDNEYSEKVYVKYFQSINVDVKQINKKNTPFSYYAKIESKGFISTYYRNPLKCCISALNIDSAQFVGWMMELLPLSEPVGAKVNSKKSIMIFKPRYTNRLITIDTDNTSERKVINLCRTDNSNALKIYSQYIDNKAPPNH